MPEPTVSISLSQLDELRAQVREANNRVAEIEKQLADARMLDPSGTIAELTALSRVMLVVVRFGVANLPPSEIRGWPWATVSVIADNLSRLPDHSADDDTLACELRLFVDEIREHEARRTRIREAQIAGVVSAATPVEPVAHRARRRWWPFK